MGRHMDRLYLTIDVYYVQYQLLAMVSTRSRTYKWHRICLESRVGPQK